MDVMHYPLALPVKMPDGTCRDEQHLLAICTIYKRLLAY